MVNRKIRKINDQEDYDKSGFKSIIEDVEKTKKEVLESVPQIPREQVPSGKEITKELLEGSTENKEKAKAHIKKVALLSSWYFLTDAYIIMISFCLPGDFITYYYRTINQKNYSILKMGVSKIKDFVCLSPIVILPL